MPIMIFSPVYFFSGRTLRVLTVVDCSKVTGAKYHKGVFTYGIRFLCRKVSQAEYDFNKKKYNYGVNYLIRHGLG